ncbi:hypothetical protein G6038_09800 [Rhodococcus sp. 14C212]|uniref:DUF6345 domain-containing protein n=1 Tax=Rhodococcus sp. 14C212 TaxID=2711209 RepID=UPI0013EB375B|nr:DUF6345 domain-containing protein [Rhodococcus sp. 14C212]NGP05768.1 hypothetical protein [Rhodococcus sp. 14C212]
MVRIGVEWITKFPLTVSSTEEPISQCQNPTLRYVDDIAWGFYLAMGANGHQQVFAWGENNAWADDFRHNDFGGDALNWSDNVHFCYYASHGGQFLQEDLINKLFIAFASQHTYCLSSSERWRLGSRMLKWFVIDSCDIVLNTEPRHIVDVWSRPMQGVHLVFGFIGLQHVGPAERGRGIAFANAVSAGRPLANAWLECSYAWHHADEVNRPIAIAAGVSREDAINRRENETLGYRDVEVRSTNWLAWKWRG